MNIKAIYPGTVRNRFFALLLISTVLAGCASDGRRAPVYERAEAQKHAAKANKSLREKDWRPKSYIVQKGDTLYSIAFNYGFDYHDLAKLNGIKNPRVISIGQEIRLFPNKAKTTPVSAPVQAKPIEILVKDQPKLVKYPYSESTMAQIDRVQQQVTKVYLSKPDVKSGTQADDSTDDEDDVGAEPTMEWSLPTKGKLISQFSEADNRKGIDIAGKLGQPVVASANGKVVYSGSGLRGYGKLIIIKHNNTFLSAYAHNSKILVMEGQSVSRGQKIAEMGKTDARQVALHFEVRRYGKPVDPAKYLPLGKT
jgi:lipoprotein NlpD